MQEWMNMQVFCNSNKDTRVIRLLYLSGYTCPLTAFQLLLYACQSSGNDQLRGFTFYSVGAPARPPERYFDIPDFCTFYFCIFLSPLANPGPR
jgi:hypothetical protein